jgi:hypothetical protein
MQTLAYHAGRADQRDEHAASADIALGRPRRLPPRIIQNDRPAFRIVRAGNPVELEYDHFRRREAELADDEFHIERRMTDLDIREEDLLRREDSLFEEEQLMEQERRFRTPRIVRRASSPVRFDNLNPFGDSWRRQPLY